MLLNRRLIEYRNGADLIVSSMASLKVLSQNLSKGTSVKKMNPRLLRFQNGVQKFSSAAFMGKQDSNKY
jgi:hypothetical protein